MVMKDPLASTAHLLVDALAGWAEFRSTVFLAKLRGAAKGYSQHEAQPFSRSFAGRNWLFMHNGDVDKQALELLRENKSRFLDPLGATDSELAFCILLGNIQSSEAMQLSDLNPETLHQLFQRFDGLGGADMVLTDGLSVACFHGSNSPKPLYYRRLIPPGNLELLEMDGASFCLKDPRDMYRTVVVFNSSPANPSEWILMEKGQLIVAKRGALVWMSGQSMNRPLVPLLHKRGDHQVSRGPVAFKHERDHRVFDVEHLTEYFYEEPVEHSTHVFRLFPVEDALQEVMHSEVTVSVPGESIVFDDVFANRSVHYLINSSYHSLRIECKSRVKIFASPNDDHTLSRRQSTFPLVWMPWQRQMMMAYLLPTELPETQLNELTEYAMSFVERNNYQLFDTLHDINQSIYKDYQYVPGSTSLATTPFEVYTQRKGVCQDFAHLFICLVRLLGIPARYQMGYIYTGNL